MQAIAVVLAGQSHWCRLHPRDGASIELVSIELELAAIGFCYDAPMNRSALRKSEGMVVRIRPIAKRFDGGPGGSPLPAMDDDWRIDNLTDEGVPISNLRTDHGTTLGYDHIHHFTSDPQRGPRNGFLSLTVQVHIGGNHLWIEPNVRP